MLNRQELCRGRLLKPERINVIARGKKNQENTQGTSPASLRSPKIRACSGDPRCLGQSPNLLSYVVFCSWNETSRPARHCWQGKAKQTERKNTNTKHPLHPAPSLLSRCMYKWEHLKTTKKYPKTKPVQYPESKPDGRTPVVVLGDSIESTCSSEN